MNAQGKSELYDLLWRIGDDLFKIFNPCEWKDGRCLNDRKSGTTGRCCSGCKYISDKGCTTKSIGCKLHCCTEVMNKYPNIGTALEVLLRVAYGAGISTSYRLSKDEVLRPPEGRGCPWRIKG